MTVLCPRCRPYGGCISVGMCEAEEPGYLEKQITRHRKKIAELKREIEFHRDKIKELI